MRIETKRFTIGLVLVPMLLLPPVASAQSTTAPTRDWSALKTVIPGSKLVTKLKNGKTVEGKLSGVSDNALSLSINSKATDINRQEIARVYQLSGKSAKKATLVGLGVGAASGAGVGAAGGDSDGFSISKPQAAAALGVLGAGVGALVGFAFGKGGHRRALIYEAK